MYRTSRLLLAALSGVALLVVATVYLAASDNWNWLRSPIEELVERSTGRVLRIDGDLRVDVLPRPRAVLEDVRLANPDWARHPWLLEGRRVEFVLDGTALLRGDVRLAELSLAGTQVALERDREGRTSWALDKAPDRNTVGPPRIGRLLISDGTLHYEDAPTDTSLVVWLHTNGRLEGLPTSFAAQGIHRGRTLRAEGHAGEVISIADTTQPFPIRGAVQAGAMRAIVAGAVTNLATFAHADLQVTLEGRDLAELFPLLPVPLPKTKPYRVEGALLRDGGRWQFREFAGRVGNSDLSGTVAFENSASGGRKPRLTGEVRSERLDLADLAGFLGEDPRPEKAGREGRVLPSDPYKVDRIRAMDVDVRFRGRRILRPNELPLDDIAAHLVIGDGIARLDPIDFGIADGRVAGRIRIDARHSPLRAHLDARAKALRLSRLLPDPQGKRGGNARIGGVIDLRGRGNSVADFFASAEGAMSFVSSGGTVSSLMVELGGLDLGEALVVLLGGDDPVPLRCGVATFTVESGIMKTDLLVLDTTDTIIVGAGRIDLAEETLALALRPEAKDPSVLSARSPLRIEGTFAKPRLLPDRTALAVRGGAALLLGLIHPLAALIPLLEPGKGKDANCTALMADARKAKPATGAVPSIQ